MTLRRFLVLLHGLSGDALYREALRRRPVEVVSPVAAQAVISRL